MTTSRRYLVVAAVVALGALAPVTPHLLAVATLNRDLIECLKSANGGRRACGFRTTATTDRATYHVGFDAYRAGDYPRSSELLQAYTSRHPDDALAGYFLGYSYWNLGNRQAAVMAWRLTGAVGALRGHARHTGAIDDYETAIAADESDPAMVYELGELLIQAGRRTEAAEVYRRGVARDTSRGYDKLLAMGRSEELDGDAQHAIETYRSAAALRPDQGEPHYRIGQIQQLVRKDLRSSLVAYQECASRTGSLPCLIAAGEVNRESGDYTAAREWGLRAAARFPKSADPYLLLATVFESRKEMSEASFAYGEAEAREPGSFWPPYDRGEFELRRGDPKSALKSLSRAAELNPISPFIYAAIGRAHRQLGDTNRADAAFARARTLSSGNPDVFRAIQDLEREN